MPSNNHLHRSKAFKTTTGVGLPKSSEGSEGDFTIRAIAKGLYLFAKHGNFWYAVSELIPYTDKRNIFSQGNPIRQARDIGGNSGNIGLASAGSKLFLDTTSTKTGVTGNNYIQSGTVATSSAIGNNFDRDFTKFIVGGRTMLILDENGSGSRILAGTNGNPSAIEAKKIYISDTYASSLGDTHIASNSADELTITVGGQSMLHFIESTTNTMESEEIAEYLIRSGTTADPVFHLKNTTNDATSPTLKFTNERSGGGNVGANDDRAGIIEFWAEDDAGNSTNVGTISSSISDVTNGSEDGYVSIEALGGTTSEIRLDSGGIINLDAANTNDTFGVQFSLNGTMVGNITGHHAKTYFTLYENIGASTNDKFYIGCGANGATEIATQDGAGTAADLTIVPDGSLSLEPSASLTLKSSVHQLEQASADADQAGYGQLWTKNATPNELYFTNDAGNDIQITSGSSMAGGGGGGTSYWIQQWSGRAYTKNLNWFRPNSIYGIAYYNWNTNTNSTSLPSTWPDSNNPMIVVPKDCTLTEYNFTGNFNSAQTYEVALMKGTGVTYGSAGDYTLSNVGSTQSQAATAMILYSIGETGLSVSLSKGDMLVPFVRRTTLDSVSQFFFELSMSIVCEVS